MIISGLLDFLRIKITLTEKPNEFENEIFKQCHHILMVVSFFLLIVFFFSLNNKVAKYKMAIISCVLFILFSVIPEVLAISIFLAFLIGLFYFMLGTFITMWAFISRSIYLWP